MYSKNSFTASDIDFEEFIFSDSLNGMKVCRTYIDTRVHMLTRAISRMNASGDDPGAYIEAVNLFNEASALLEKIVSDRINAEHGSPVAEDAAGKSDGGGGDDEDKR